MIHLKNMTEPEIRHYMGTLAGVIREVMPAGENPSGRALFVLLVFDEPKLGHYVSNCSRENMVEALREVADRLERQEDVPR